jgi:chromosome segregation ATPase
MVLLVILLRCIIKLNVKKEGEFEKHKREQVAADRHEDLKTSVHDRIDKTDDAVFGQKNQETGERSGGLQSQVQSHDTRLSDHDTQLTSHNQRITNNANRISVNQTKQDKMQNNLTQVNKTQKQHGQRINNVETDTKDLYDHATKPDDKV